jgi:hypothetical protein
MIFYCFQRMFLYIETLQSFSRFFIYWKKIRIFKENLKYKYIAGLNSFKPIVTDNLVADLNSSKTMHCSMNYMKMHWFKEWRDYTNKGLTKWKNCLCKIGDATNSRYCHLKKVYRSHWNFRLDSLQLKLNKFTKVHYWHHTLILLGRTLISANQNYKTSLYIYRNKRWY